MASVEKKLFNKLPLHERNLVVLKVLDHTGDRLEKDCRNCGACCIAFSIKNLKNQAERCPFLVESQGKHLCGIYEQRPDECRKYDCEGIKTQTPLQRARAVELYSAQHILQKDRDVTLYPKLI